MSAELTSQAQALSTVAHPRPPRTGLVWPGWHNLRATVPLALLVFAVFTLVYGGLSFITGLHPWRFRLYTQAELAIPFRAEWSPVYVSMDLMLVLALFVFPRRQDILPLCATIIAEILIAAPFFLFLPLEDGFTHPGATGFFGYFFAFADAANLSHNYLPSLHVAFAATLALAFWPRFRWVGRAFFTAWALAIAASTVLLHEHHIADVIAGLLLAWLSMRYIYPRVATPAFLAAAEIDFVCLGEFARFSRRHPRYLLAAAWLYLHSLPRWVATRPFRASYCLVQHLDDVLDGDRAVSDNPPDYARRLLAAMEAEVAGEPFEEAGSFLEGKYDPITTLARFVARASRIYETTPGEFLDNFRALLDVLLFDWQRRQTRRILSAAELTGHHRRTFSYPANLAFLLLRSRLRAADAADVIAALAWCSPIRDLAEDWRSGLINIPREVLAQAESQTASPHDFTALSATPALRVWLRAEFTQAQAHLRAAEAALPHLPDDPGALLLKRLTRSLHRYARAYARKHPEALDADPA